MPEFFFWTKVRRRLMKRFLWLIIVGIFVILLTAAPVMAAAPPDNPGKGPADKEPLDKIIFVHYPNPNSAFGKPEGKPGGGGTSGGTGVSCPDYKYSGVR
jgi:hypothetical protein